MSHFVIFYPSQWVPGFEKPISGFKKKSPRRFFIHPEWNSRRLVNKNPNEDLPIKRTSITLEDPVYEAGQQIASKRGFGQSFSAYIAWLIQRDAEGGVTREDAVLRSPSKAPKKTAKSVKPAKPAKNAKTAKRPKARK